MAKKRFVGFGCGPIQLGLILYEAMASGNFDRFTVAEIDHTIVEAVRRQKNKLFINIARKTGIEKVRLEDIRLLNPAETADRQDLSLAIREADELATAIPRVNLYGRGGRGSIASLLAHSIGPDRQRVLYAAENNNFAASILEGEILNHTSGEGLSRFQILDTVIGKMSGVIGPREEIERLDLAPVSPSLPRAILVEEFNRILVSEIRLKGFTRGIEVFEEKEDLLPFEEVKLFGHNAIHALLGYLAYRRGYRRMSDIRPDSPLYSLGREAFQYESGEALLRKYSGLGDPLFTRQGFYSYAEDLLERMVNPFLFDSVQRVCRDPVRKLGYDDRFFGLMRLALNHGVVPKRLARGALAALCFIIEERIPLNAAFPPSTADLTGKDIPVLLDAVWRGDKTDQYRTKCISLVQEALHEPY
jgi:mannitol-1-phosphate 5-dehydrogenase